MATCKDCVHEIVCDALIKSGCPYLDEEIFADAFCMAFRNKADVATKSEIAREIFEEIDSMIFGTILPDDCAIISIARLAELKKKYTEDHYDSD